MITVNNINTKAKHTTRFVCISDTHGKINFDIPDGDVLIHAGDISRRSTIDEYNTTFYWLSTLPHKIKLIIGGNHDHFLDERFDCIEEKQTLLAMMENYGLTYVEHEIYQLPLEYGSLKLFLSPYAPIHLGGAFMLEDMSEIWNNIPSVDILVTHTPPLGFGDKIIRGRHVGCKYLKDRMDTVIKPKVSIFGHIHEGHGYEFDGNGVLYINACLSDHRYRAINKPITFDFFK